MEREKKNNTNERRVMLRKEDWESRRRVKKNVEKTKKKERATGAEEGAVARVT